MRRLVAARRAGDEAAARRYWEELLVANFDRVRAFVALESRGRLSTDEQQDALQRALVRIATNMFETFRGASVGEYVEAVRTLVKFACIDTQRRAATHSRRERPLDAGGAADDAPGSGRLDAEVYAAIDAQRRELESREEDASGVADGQAFLDWAVPQLSPQRRAVIELDRRDVPVQEIQARLGVSRDVVYASRSRALRDLARLRSEYEP